MKKTLALVLILCLAISALAASSPRLDAMGGIGIAVAGYDMQSYVNPAAVFFDNNRHIFALNIETGDQIGQASIPYVPQLSANALFVADMMTLGLDVNFNSQNRRDDGKVDLYQDTTLKINFSVGYKYVSAGIGILAGSTQQRLNVPMSNILDFPMQTLFSQFTRVQNSETIEVSAGLMTKISGFHIGILLSNILGKDDEGSVFNWSTLFSQTGIGIYWSREEYSKRGRANNFIYSVGLDFDHLFSNERRVNTGAEIQFRLVRDSSIFARAGFSTPFNDISQGYVSAGLGGSFRFFEGSLNVRIPFTDKPTMTLSLMFMF